MDVQMRQNNSVAEFFFFIYGKHVVRKNYIDFKKAAPKQTFLKKWEEWVGVLIYLLKGGR